MKTKEFIKKVEELGYKIVKEKENDLEVLRISSSIYNILFYIYPDVEFQFRTYEDFVVSLTRQEQTELFDLVIEYAKTPIEEREEEKKYTLSLPMYYSDDWRIRKCLDKVSDGVYLFESEDELRPISTFTQKEIDSLPHQDFIKALVKEEV